MSELLSWQVLTAIYVVLFSLSIILRRILVRDTDLDPYAFAGVYQALIGVVLMGYSFIHGWSSPDFGRFWWPILVSSVFFAGAHVTSVYALRKVDATVFSLLMATSAFWTMAGAIMILDENLTLIQVLGVIVLTASIALLFSPDSRHSRDKRLGLYFGILTGFLFGIAIFTWAYVGKYNDAATWNTLSFLFPVIIIALLRPQSLRNVTSLFRGKNAMAVPLLAVIYAFASMASLLGFAKGNINIVAPLQQTSTIVTMVVAVIVLRERDHLVRKALSALLCVTAVVLLM